MLLHFGRIIRVEAYGQAWNYRTTASPADIPCHRRDTSQGQRGQARDAQFGQALKRSASMAISGAAPDSIAAAWARVRGSTRAK